MQTAKKRVNSPWLPRSVTWQGPALSAMASSVCSALLQRPGRGCSAHPSALGTAPLASISLSHTHTWGTAPLLFPRLWNFSWPAPGCGSNSLPKPHVSRRVCLCYLDGPCWASVCHCLNERNERQSLNCVCCGITDCDHNHRVQHSGHPETHTMCLRELSKVSWTQA